MGTSCVSPSEVSQSSLSLIHRPLLWWGLPGQVAKWEGAAAFALLSADKSGPGALEPGLGQPTGGLTETREKPEFASRLHVCGAVLFSVKRACLLAQTSGPSEIWTCPWLSHRDKHHPSRTSQEDGVPVCGSTKRPFMKESLGVQNVSAHLWG